MPSLNRPNAPDRLPSSDFGNLFGRPRAVHGSDLTSPISTPSPLTTPTNYIAAQRRMLRSSEGANANPAPTSPLASPPTPLVARQRPKQVDRRSYHSDISAASPRESSRVASPSNETPLIIEEEPIPLKRRTASESSSISSRTREVLGFSDNRLAPHTGSEQPPSKARSGFKWKREFSGRWLEIRIGRKEEHSAEHSAHASGEATPVPLSQRTTIPLPLTQASTTTDIEARDRSSNAASDQRLLPETRRDSFEFATLTPREGLYCRTKRALGLKRDPINPDSALERTSTDRLLDRVSSTLRFLPDRRTPSPSSATSVSNLSIAAPRWQRVLSRQGKVGLSTSSSIREVLMGKPPIHTPEPEAMYTGSDSHQYVAVNLTDDGVAFLPSEARRIHTPPLPSDATSPGVGKVRGFFFDYNAPPAPGFPHRPAADANGHHAQQQQQHQQQQQQQQPAGRPRRDSDWYRVKMHAIEAESLTREQLALSVPEHLPNSPLCPRHPKHASGGTGECPYHGRNPSWPEGGEETGRAGPKAEPAENWW